MTPTEDAGGVSGECRPLSPLPHPPPSRSAPATGSGSEAQGLGSTCVLGECGQAKDSVVWASCPQGKCEE